MRDVISNDRQDSLPPAQMNSLRPRHSGGVFALPSRRISRITVRKCEDPGNTDFLFPEIS